MGKATELVRNHKSVTRNGQMTFSAAFSVRSDQANGGKGTVNKKKNKPPSRSSVGSGTLSASISGSSNSGSSSSSSNSSSIKATKEPRRCYGCGSTDHLLNKCQNPFAHTSSSSTSSQQRNVGFHHRNAHATQAEEMEDPVFNFGVHMVLSEEDVAKCDHIHITLPAIRTKLNPTDIAVDNQAEAHLFGNIDLLYDVEKNSKTVGFTGISGGPIVTNVAGIFAGIRNVFTDKSSPINILSWSCLQDNNREIRKRSCEASDTFMLILREKGASIFMIAQWKTLVYIQQCRRMNYCIQLVIWQRLKWVESFKDV